MRAHRAIPTFTALILLAACSSESSQVGDTTTVSSAGSTSAPASTAGPSTSGEVTDPLADVWVQPTGAPMLYFADDRGTAAAPLSTMITMDSTGATTELWGESGEVSSRIVDVSADGTRVLVSRYQYGEGVVGFRLVERDLATGEETLIAERELYFAAKYALDGSGDIFITEEVDEIADGVVTSSTYSLDRIVHDGSPVANLYTTTDAAEGMPWLQVLVDGELAMVIGGAPMTLVGGLGQAMPELPVGTQFCAPVRQVDDSLLVSCHEPGGNFFSQLWMVPFDGSEPVQITRLVDGGSGVDFGAGDLWTTTNGRQFVQRYGDCGAAWIEELTADGTTIESDATGVILGVDGTRLITAANGACDGYWATIATYDTATGVTTTFLAPPDATEDHPYGVNAFDILAVPA